MNPMRTHYSFVSVPEMPVTQVLRVSGTDVRTRSTVRPGATAPVVAIARPSSVPPPPSAALLDRESRFMGRVASHLKGLGAVGPTSEYWWRPWVLQTRAGKLYVNIYGNRILCRFEDQARAAGILNKTGSNRLAEDGTWNFVFAEGPGQDQVNVFKIEISVLRRTTMSGVAEEGYVSHNPDAVPVVVPPSIRPS